MIPLDLAERRSYSFPTQIRYGCGCVDELAEHLQRQSIHRPLLVTDENCAKLSFFGSIREQLTKANFDCTLYTGVSVNPVKTDVDRGVETFRENRCDAIVGIGGGASLDVARMIALMAHHQEFDLFHFEDGSGNEKDVRNEIPYFLTIPTTSGTGSEVGRSGVIIHPNTLEKKIIFAPQLMARQVFVDPELSLTLPPSITAATGMDAMTHCIEAYLAPTFHPLAQGIALEGIRLIGESLVDACRNPNIQNRGKMAMAALMGAVAFQKGLGVVHALAHPLSSLCGLHHGLANAIMLPHGVAFNETVAAAKIREIGRVLNTEELVPFLHTMNKSIGIEDSLSSQGVTEDLLGPLATMAKNDISLVTNPREACIDELVSLYRNAL
ncbi:MAG: iron-containing alcohol dehydrogenase [Pseudomonadota bacterium]